MGLVQKYLHPNLVAFLTASTRDEALKSLIDTIEKKHAIPESAALYRAIIEREGIVSTGIGMGVAIPHAKLPAYRNFFIAIGILSKGVDWDALDDAPVRIIFLIGGPDDKQTEYLQILSNLTHAIKDESRRKKMLTLNSEEGIIGLFDGF